MGLFDPIQLDPVTRSHLGSIRPKIGSIRIDPPISIPSEIDCFSGLSDPEKGVHFSEQIKKHRHKEGPESRLVAALHRLSEYNFRKKRSSRILTTTHKIRSTTRDVRSDPRPRIDPRRVTFDPIRSWIWESHCSKCIGICGIGFSRIPIVGLVRLYFSAILHLVPQIAIPHLMRGIRWGHNF